MRILFLLFIFTIKVCSTRAQENNMVMGMEGGAGISFMRGNEFLEDFHKKRLSTIEGIFVQYNFNEIISLLSGIYYELKGSSFEIEATDQTGSPIGIIHGSENYNFLTIPLLARSTFGKKFKYFINTGPYFSYLFKQIEYTEAFQSYPEIVSDRTENFKKQELGWTLGFGFSYCLKNKFIFSFEARDNLGLNNTSALPVYQDGSIKTNALNFIFGFGIKLGKTENSTIEL